MYLHVGVFEYMMGGVLDTVVFVVLSAWCVQGGRVYFGRNVPEAVYFTVVSMYNEFVVFGDNDIFLRKGSHTIIVTEFTNWYKESRVDVWK